MPVRALIDTDPVFTQIRHLTEPAASGEARRHNVFFTFGECFGRPGCTIPDDGLPWQPTRQPVVLEAWPAKPGAPHAPYTTVMQWESYPPREYGGRRFGLKADSFAPYLDLPERSGHTFELAVGSPTAPREALAEKGWRVIDPRIPTRSPWSYQEYIRTSKAEFGVAKHGYVATRSGWFSERTCGYLASGRPAVVQDTGFSQLLPTGRGLLAFSDPMEVMAGLESVEADYPAHCQAAREVVTDCFDSSRVLSDLLDRASPVSVAGERPS